MAHQLPDILSNPSIQMARLEGSGTSRLEAEHCRAGGHRCGAYGWSRSAVRRRLLGCSAHNAYNLDLTSCRLACTFKS